MGGGVIATPCTTHRRRATQRRLFEWLYLFINLLILFIYLLQFYFLIDIKLNYYLIIKFMFNLLIYYFF